MANYVAPLDIRTANVLGKSLALFTRPASLPYPDKNDRSWASPPKETLAIADAVCGLAGCPPVPDWLHSLEKQIAAGQLTVEEAVLTVIEFYVETELPP
jgi:hypothetical protein